MLKQLSASLRGETSFNNQPATSLLTTCNRIVVNNLSHPDFCLLITIIATCCNLIGVIGAIIVCGGGETCTFGRVSCANYFLKFQHFVSQAHVDLPYRRSTWPNTPQILTRYTNARSRLTAVTTQTTATTRWVSTALAMATPVYVITTGKQAVAIIASMLPNTMKVVGRGTGVIGALGDRIVSVPRKTKYENPSGRSFEATMEFM